MQNQSELPPSQNVALTAEDDISQPQTSQQLRTQRVDEWVEMQIKTIQPKEMILQQAIKVKIAEEKNRTCQICF